MRESAHVNCCGFKHITVMGSEGDVDKQLQDLIGIVQGMSNKPSLSSNRVFEIILNDNQCKQNPKLLKMMAALGFVFIGRQNNGAHDSWVNIFLRMQRNGREFKSAPFKYDGLDVSETIAEFQTEPVQFVVPEVINPFAMGKGIFNTSQINEIVAPKPKARVAGMKVQA